MSSEFKVGHLKQDDSSEPERGNYLQGHQQGLLDVVE